MVVRRRMLQAGLVLGAGLSVLVFAPEAYSDTVTLKNGREIHGRLVDTKPLGLCLADGTPLTIHDMAIDLFVDPSTFEIVSVSVASSPRVMRPNQTRCGSTRIPLVQQKVKELLLVEALKRDIPMILPCGKQASLENPPGNLNGDQDVPDGTLNAL